MKNNVSTILEELNYRDKVMSFKRVYEEKSSKKKYSGFAPDEMRKGKHGNYERNPQNKIHSLIKIVVTKEVEKHKETYLRLSIGDMCYNNDDYVIVRLFGGRNGNGEWKLYWAELYQFIKALQETLISKEELNRDIGAHINVWLIDLINDCPDDVFDMIIGVGLK